jgi:hypothetical protein
MRRAMLLILAGLVVVTPVRARTPLGQYARWGAFREAPGRCVAASEPTGGGSRGSRPFVAIGRATHGGPPRLHIVPSRTPRSDSPLRLDIGGRSFTLTGAGGRDAREDQHIIAAIRRADRLRVMGVDARGRRFHDDYPLAGAPSAIDAAILGCL